MSSFKASRLAITIPADGGEHVPAILQLPAASAPVPSVLLLHGFSSRKNGQCRFDQTVRPEQAKALFAAAGEPNELRWYDGGHWPPQSAIDSVATWLAERLTASSAHSRLA